MRNERLRVLVPVRSSRKVDRLRCLAGGLRRRFGRQAARKVRRRRKQRGDLLPAGRSRIDRGPEGDRVPAVRRNRPRRDHLQARVGPHRRRPQDDRRRRRRHDAEAVPRRRSRRRDRRLRRPQGQSDDRAQRPAARLRHSDDRGPRPAGRLRPLRRPGLLEGRQGGDRHRLHQGQRRGRTDRRPGQGLARQDLRPGRRPRGQDHRRRRLLGRRDRSLRRHQRDPAAGRGQPRDLPADRHLPLADVLPDPAGRGDLRRAALALARLRPHRARRDRQRAVELDHVGPRPGRGDRLRPAAGLPLPRGAAPHRRQARGDAHRAGLGRPGDLRLGGDRDRRPALPDARQGQRDRGPRPDRRDGRSPARRSRCSPCCRPC